MWNVMGTTGFPSRRRSIRISQGLWLCPNCPASRVRRMFSRRDAFVLWSWLWEWCI